VRASSVGVSVPVQKYVYVVGYVCRCVGVGGGVCVDHIRVSGGFG